MRRREIQTLRCGCDGAYSCTGTPCWAAFELPPYPLTRALRLVQHALRHWDGRADSFIGRSMTETVRRGSLREPTPLKPDAALLSPITPREQGSEQGFKKPTMPGGAGKADKHEKKGKKRAKPVDKPNTTKKEKQKKKRQPLPDADSDDSDDDLSLEDLKRKPSSPSTEEPGPKKQALAAAGREFDVGAAVVLAPNVSISGAHVLSDGAQGVVLEVELDPEDDEPYKVVGKDGATYWYEARHLAAAPPSALVAGDPSKQPLQSAAVEKRDQEPEHASTAKAWLDEGLESRLLGLADSGESEDEADENPARNKRRAPLASSSDEEGSSEVAATLTYSPAIDEAQAREDEMDDDEQPNRDQPSELVNTWVTIEFNAQKDKKQVREWHDCLVVDYDRATSQHLVKWAEGGKEEWLPAIKSGEFEPAESQAKQKCKEVVFDNNVKLPPVEKPELVGSTYKVIKPVKINSGQSRDSSEVGTCRPGDVIKVLKACELNGQLRLMYYRGWTSAASRKGAKFLLKTKSVLHITKEDKRAMRKVEKRAKEEEERQQRDHLEVYKAATALTESWVAACAKAELRSQKQTAAAAAALHGDGSNASAGSQDQWRKKRRHALSGADDSDEEDNDDAVTQEETEDLYNKVNAEQKVKEDAPIAASVASVPQLTGLQALFAKRASSAATLQSVVRTARVRREFRARREAAVGIQALVRGMLARDDVFEIRMDLIAKLKAENSKRIADAKAARVAKAKQNAAEEAANAAKAAAEAELAAAAEIDWGAEDLDVGTFSVSATGTHQLQPEADTAADGIDWSAVDLQQMDMLASKQAHEPLADDDPFATMDDSALAALEQRAPTQ